MSRQGISDDDWYAGRTVPGGRFRHNESVHVIAGEHAGKRGALISVESLKPEPVYLVELGSGEGDLLLPDSSLAPAE
jgi:hypothetical protein